MKQINGYWVDGNNNRWSCELYTKEKAEEWSKTLVDCDNCDNCDNCHDCHNCHNCDNCHDCRNCDNCCNCDNCFGCHDYKQNPQRYVTGHIGSRNKQATFYYLDDDEMGDKKIQVVCGCFRGNIEEFEQAVLETHADNDDQRKQCLKEIAKVKVLFELEEKNE